MNRATMLDLLHRNAEDLERYLHEIPADRLHWHEEGEWSAHETLAHLCEIERHVFLVRMQRVLQEDKPTLKYFDETGWHQDHYDAQQSLDAMLADFADARRQQLDLLGAQSDWGRWGIHEKLQKRYSLAFLAEYTLHHTWEHLNQIVNTQIAYELANQTG